MVKKLIDRLKPLFVDRTTRRLILVSAILNFVTWVLLLIRLFPSISGGKMISLHYNVYLNVNAVGPALFALMPALIGLIILLVNVVLVTRLYVQSRQNALVVLSITLFYEFLTFLSGFFIILINTPK